MQGKKIINLRRLELFTKKMAGCLHRTAQPPTLATFRSWGSSAGAGRARPAAAKIENFSEVPG